MRVPYVFCVADKKAKGFERARPPYVVTDGKAIIDYEYYITKRLRNPIEDVLSVVFGQEACDSLFNPANYGVTKRAADGTVLLRTRVKRSAQQPAGPIEPVKKARQTTLKEMLAKRAADAAGEASATVN